PVYVKHWATRAVCLIAVPAAIYIWSFWLHFLILNMSGPGDAQMSSLFQAGLEGNKFHENPLMIAYGSKITLKNNGYGGGLLHSHVQAYPSGSKQQQVTCYHHKDSNNNWIVRPPRDAKISQEGDEVQYVKEGDVIRLVHASTGRNLHSHAFKAPVTTSQWEVSAYGNDTVGDSNDYWRVEIVDDIYDGRVETVRSLTTRIRLRHVPQGCLLRSHGVNLPQWGFKQAEVVCDKKNDLSSLNNMWNVEQHWNEMRTKLGFCGFRLLELFGTRLRQLRGGKSGAGGGGGPIFRLPMH
ncbi:MAG: MIR motif-containing protein, partial [Olpidium bornovanus]